MKYFVMILAGLLSVQATAEEGAGFILTAGSNGSISLQSTSSGGMAKTISASVGLGHCLGSFEVIASAGYSGVSTSTGTVSSTSLSGQINYAWSEQHRDALYVGGRVGSNIVTSSSTLFFGGVLGKRISISGPVSYDPNVSVTFFNLSTGISTPLIRVTPLQFTLVF